jgi:hypothetical protein
METDSPNEHQDLNTFQDGSISPHPGDGNVSIKGLPLLSRHQSLEDLPRARRYASAVAGSSVNRLDMQLKEMEQARAHETQANAKLDASKQHWQQLRKDYRKSRIKYENAIDPFGTLPGTVSINQNIAELRERFINDRSRLESHAADVRKIQRKLQAAQDSRSRAELYFMKSARQWTRAPIVAESSFPLNSAQERSQVVVPSVASPSDVEFMLERYYSKVAAVDSLGERLADHDYEYWNDVARRELLRDHEESLSVGDDEFEEASEREKTDILQELSKAMEEAAQLKADCVSAGAEVQDHGPSGVMHDFSSDLTSVGNGDSLRSALAKVPTEAFQDVENISGDVSDHGSAHSDTGKASELITSWMDAVPLNRDAEGILDLPNGN